MECFLFLLTVRRCRVCMYVSIIYSTWWWYQQCIIWDVRPQYCLVNPAGTKQQQARKSEWLQHLHMLPLPHSRPRTAIVRAGIAASHKCSSRSAVVQFCSCTLVPCVRCFLALVAHVRVAVFCRGWWISLGRGPGLGLRETIGLCVCLGWFSARLESNHPIGLTCILFARPAFFCACYLFGWRDRLGWWINCSLTDAHASSVCERPLTCRPRSFTWALQPNGIRVRTEAVGTDGTAAGAASSAASQPSEFSASEQAVVSRTACA